MSCNNTNNTCTSCNHNYSSCNNKCAKCGCRDSFLTSPPPCPTPQVCPDPIPCQEVLASDCIIYTGLNILCNKDIVVYSDATWTEILEDIVAYFCNALTNISSKCTLKYVEDFTSEFDGDIHVIPGTALIDCGFFTLANQGCSRFATTTYLCDFNFSLYYLFGGVWKSIPEKPFGTASTQGYELEINNTTGDITITFNIGPIDVVPVRVVIIG